MIYTQPKKSAFIDYRQQLYTGTQYLSYNLYHYNGGILVLHLNLGDGDDDGGWLSIEANAWLMEDTSENEVSRSFD